MHPSILFLTLPPPPCTTLLLLWSHLGINVQHAAAIVAHHEPSALWCPQHKLTELEPTWVWAAAEMQIDSSEVRNYHTFRTCCELFAQQPANPALAPASLVEHGVCMVTTCMQLPVAPSVALVMTRSCSSALLHG
jgi:hypothetical protein